MSKSKLSNNQKRSRKVAKKNLKKRNWDEQCAARLITAAKHYNERIKVEADSEVFDIKESESDNEEQVVGE